MSKKYILIQIRLPEDDCLDLDKVKKARPEGTYTDIFREGMRSFLSKDKE